jgi:hypothetical protein
LKNRQSNLSLNVEFKFSLNIINIKLYENKSMSYDDIYEENDFDLSTKGKINDHSESNLGLVVNNNPFYFYIFRKGENGNNNIIYDSRCDDNHNSFKYDEGVIEMCLVLPFNHYSYGLVIILFYIIYYYIYFLKGENYDGIKLDKNKTYFIMANGSIDENIVLGKDKLLIYITLNIINRS